MKVLIDNQLPHALGRFLARRGCQCQHVLDVGLAKSSDIDIWRYAAQNGMVLVSKDEDFFHLAQQPGVTAQLIWVRLGNCRTARLLAALEKVWPRIEQCLAAGDRIVEVQ